MTEVYQNQKQQANQSPYHGLSTEECIAMEKQAVNAVKLFAKCNRSKRDKLITEWRTA